MRAIADYILRGRMQAVGITSLFSLLSLLMPPLAYLLSGVPVALVALRQGPVLAIQVMLGSMLLVMAFLIIIGVTPLLALSMALGVWLPVMFCAVYLRRSSSQAMLLLAAAIVAASYAAVIRLIVGDVAEWWREQLIPQLERALEQPDPQTMELLEALLPYVNSFVAAGLAFSLILAVLIARWWQAMLFNPGGFGEEFRAISLPRASVAVAVFCVFGALLLEGQFADLLRDWVFILVVLYLFQGISLCHAHVKQRGWGVHWLWALYLFLLFFPQTTLFVACLGFADAWLRGTQPRLVNGGNGPDSGSGGPPDGPDARS